MKNLGLSVIITLLFVWPLFVNLFTLKYLTDIKKNEYCRGINSPYLNWFFDYYLFGLVLLIVSLMASIYIINNKQTPNIKIMSLKNLFSSMMKDTKKGKVKEGLISKIITLLIIGISIFYVKLLYDIGNEETCKDIDHTMRHILFYYNLAAVIYSGFVFLKNLKN
tara:strand:- start:1033 stop:1527 length:495 start_codon:yes stop_codon:yes gene_type:complete